MWNDEFKFSDYLHLVSNIQDYIDCILKMHNTLPTNPPVHIYITWFNNKLMFKIKHEYKLELQTPENVKLFHTNCFNTKKK